MIKYRHKGKFALLCMLLMAVFLTSVPVPAQAGLLDFGFETLPFADKEENDCSLAEDQAAASSNRWWKAPVEAITDACVSVGDSTFNTVAGGAVKLMLVGAGLWLAIFTLKIVGGMQESDPLENITKVGGLMLKCGIAYWFLTNRDEFFGLVAAITETAAGFVGLGGGGGSGLKAVVAPLEGMTESIHTAVSNVEGAGDFVTCISEIHRLSISVVEFDLSDPAAWTAGCMLEFGAWVLKVAFPFFILDALFRVGITAALCPLFIVAWVFPSTADFAKKGFNSFLNVAFIFMFLKIGMDLALEVLKTASGIEGLQDNDTSKTEYMCMFRWTGFKEEETHICEKYQDKVSSAPLIVFAACIFYSLLLLKESGQFANFYSDTQFSNDNAFQAAKGAANATQGMAKLGVQAGGKVADKISQGKDRKAARMVEQDRRGRAEAAKSGKPYIPKVGDKKLANAENRLKKKGALNADGSENNQYRQLLQNGKRRTAMRGLENLASGKTGADLHNHVAETKNWIADSKLGRALGVSKMEKISTEGFSSRYADVSKTYEGSRDKAEVQSLKNIPTGNVPNPRGSGTPSAGSTPSGTRASTSSNVPRVLNSVPDSSSKANSMKLNDSAQYVNNKKAALTTSNALDTAKRMQASQASSDPAYAGSPKEQLDSMSIQKLSMQKSIADKTLNRSGYEGSEEAKRDHSALNDLNKQTATFAKSNGMSQNDSVGTKAARSEGKKMSDAIRNDASSISNSVPASSTPRSETARMNHVASLYEGAQQNRQYDDTAQGKNQQAYDQMVVGQMKDAAEIAKKRSSVSGYSGSVSERADMQKMTTNWKALDAMKKETGVDNSLAKKAFSKKAGKWS